MGDVPTTDNSAADVADEVIADVAKVGEAAAETAAFTYLPWLKLPVVRQLFEAAMDWINGFIRKPIELEATILIIRFETANEKADYLSALAALTAQVTAKASAGTITAEEKAWMDSVSRFVHSDGSATPK